MGETFKYIPLVALLAIIIRKKSNSNRTLVWIWVKFKDFPLVVTGELHINTKGKEQKIQIFGYLNNHSDSKTGPCLNLGEAFQDFHCTWRRADEANFTSSDWKRRMSYICRSNRKGRCTNNIRIYLFHFKNILKKSPVLHCKWLKTEEQLGCIGNVIITLNVFFSSFGPSIWRVW